MTDRSFKGPLSRNPFSQESNLDLRSIPNLTLGALALVAPLSYKMETPQRAGGRLWDQFMLFVPMSESLLIIGLSRYSPFPSCVLGELPFYFLPSPSPLRGCHFSRNKFSNFSIPKVETLEEGRLFGVSGSV